MTFQKSFSAQELFLIVNFGNSCADIVLEFFDEWKVNSIYLKLKSFFDIINVFAVIWSLEWKHEEKHFLFQRKSSWP